MAEAEEAPSAYWDRRAETWVRRAARLQSTVDRYGLPPMEALALAPGERVLDIGCGPGFTTLAMAKKVAPEGEAVGVDISPAMIEAAIGEAHEVGVANASFVVADAQTDALGLGFDAAYSRFGVMFFADPGAAFANIAAALRPGGRLAFVVWGPVDVNPWMAVPTQSTASALGVAPPPPRAPHEPGAFSMADPERVERVLAEAGFGDIDNEPIEGTRDIGADTATEDVRAMVEIGPMREEFLAADGDSQRRVVDAILEALDDFRTDRGWAVPGLARRVTAVRR